MNEINEHIKNKTLRISIFDSLNEFGTRANSMNVRNDSRFRNPVDGKPMRLRNLYRDLLTYFLSLGF